jgi:hypothetical protein
MQPTPGSVIGESVENVWDLLQSMPPPGSIRAAREMPAGLLLAIDSTFTLLPTSLPPRQIFRHMRELCRYALGFK